MPLMSEQKICIKCSETKNIQLFEKSRNVCRICRLVQVQKARNAKKVTVVTVSDKTCNKCKVMKNASEFNKLSNSPDGLNSNCRLCYKSIRKPNRKIVTTTNNIVTICCCKCNTEKSSSMFRTNSKSTTGYFKTCMDCWKPSTVTKEQQREYDRTYRQKHPEKLREKYRKQGQKLQRKIKDRLRARITSALSCTNYKKTDKTINYLGCSISYLKQWLEYQFTNEMSWNNYHTWHIDHVIPCDSFDLSNEEEQYKCFNWSNLRPCFIKENLTKRAKIIPSLIDRHKQMALEFMRINPLPNQPGNRVDGTD